MPQTTGETAGKLDVMIKVDPYFRRLKDWFNANPAFAIAISYVAVASLWILFSDRIAEWLFQSPGQLTLVQTYKGLAFVTTTGTILYLLLRRQIRARLKIQKRQLELEQQQELVALRERFVSMASHDFRTPLAIIKMSTDMLEAYFDEMSPERRQTKIQDIAAQTDRMIALLDDVLTISRVNAGKIEVNRSPVEVERFCREVWRDFQAQASQTHKIEFACDGVPSQAMLDTRLMRLVLGNLLSNALKYTPEGRCIRFGVTHSSPHLVFRVRDEGIGIPAQDQPRLFEPFYRATNVHDVDGTGLGLAIVRNYVEALGGSITVESQEGRGTTVTVQIPLETVAS